MLEACCQFAAPMGMWAFALLLPWAALIGLAILTCPHADLWSKSHGKILLSLGAFLLVNILLLAIEIALMVVSIAAASDGLLIHACPEAFGDFYERNTRKGGVWSRNAGLVASPVFVIIMLYFHIFVIREAVAHFWTKTFGTSDKEEKSPGSKESK